MPLVAVLNKTSQNMQTMDYRDAIERYYRAYRDRDREAVRRLLTPDFQFVSSFGNYHGRDDMLDQIWPAVGGCWATKLRIFGEAPEFVVIYEHETANGIVRPPVHLAEHLRFDGDRIARIELFVGPPEELEN